MRPQLRRAVRLPEGFRKLLIVQLVLEIIFIMFSSVAGIPTLIMVSALYVVQQYTVQSIVHTSGTL